MRKNDPEGIHTIFVKLKGAKLFYFPPIRKKLSAPTEHGVYIIFNPKGEVVHVGRSVRGKNGLLQRIKNHLRGHSSFVKSYLKGDGNKLRKGYGFRFLEVSKPRTRALLEALAVGKLCPKHLGVGVKEK